MSGETSGGFGRTAGSIAAIVVAIVLVVGGYIAWGRYREAVDALADKKIVTADSLQRSLEAVQKGADLALARQRDSLSQLVTAANTRTASTQYSSAVELAALRARMLRSDSLLSRAVTAADSAAAAELARPPSLDSTIALLSHQHALDSGATALQASAASSCLVSLSGCALGRIRADSIAGFWQTKFQAERKKIPPKWQSVTVTIGEAIGVALLTKLILK